MFTHFTPAGVVINNNNEIVHFHGDTSPFLIQSPGKPTLNILKMAREGLSFALRNALIKGKRKNEISRKNIPLKNKDYVVDFDVVQLDPKEETYSLIVFKKHDIPPTGDFAESSSETDKHRIQLLESELAQLRADIRTVSEAQEAANEELQSANEELLSSSEELQSLNEELETSGEELQSNNEELISVNDELMDRQEQLILARKQAEAIVETIREPLVLLDGTLRIKSANSAFYRVFQCNQHTVEGLSIYDIGHSGWHTAELRTLLQDILPNKTKVENFEITGSFGAKGQKSLLLNARQLLNSKSAEPLILLIFEDITDRKMSKILRESEAHFRTMADTAPVLLWISDPDMSLTFLNKSWLDYTGRTFEQEMGMGWTENVHPADLHKTMQAYTAFYNKQVEFTLEYRLKRNDGEYRWISLKAVPRISSEGVFMGYIGGCMDIHEQKNFYSELEIKVDKRTKELRESEAFLQSILNTTQNLIYLYDFKKEKVVFINKKAFEATGYTSEEIEMAKTDIFTSLIHPRDLPAINKQRRILRESSDGKMATVEFMLKNRNGEWTCQLSRDLVFKRDNKGNALQCIGVATDISEIKHVNEQLIAKNIELEHSNTELASFSSIASHDLKEPLRKIQIFSKLVIAKDSENVSVESKEFLERVIVSAYRMQQLIDDLISYSRTGSQKIVYTESDLNVLLNEVIEDLREVITESNAKLDIADMPFASVIPSQFRQLFVNLISNAIKYARAGVPPHIKIFPGKPSATEILAIGATPNINYLKIKVSDNGIGFAEEFRTRIFEPFQRLHGKDEYSGTGIGLAICKKIMVNHNGYITAESEEGKGASFYIYVPHEK